MKKLFRWFFPKKTLWPYCTKTYSFPPWPNPDVGHCGDVTWIYTAVKGRK